MFAITEVSKLASFAVKAINGDLVGYWHGPESIDIKNAPIVKYDTEGQFSILRGSNLMEANVAEIVFDDEDEFLEFQVQFQRCGIKIGASWGNLIEQQPKTSPDELHKKIYYKRLENKPEPEK